MLKAVAGHKKPRGIVVRPWASLRVALPQSEDRINVWEVLGSKWAGFHAWAVRRDGRLVRVVVNCPRGARVVRELVDGQPMAFIQAPAVLWAREDGTEDAAKRGAVYREAHWATDLLLDDIGRGRTPGTTDVPEVHLAKAIAGLEERWRKADQRGEPPNDWLGDRLVPAVSARTVRRYKKRLEDRPEP